MSDKLNNQGENPIEETAEALTTEEIVEETAEVLETEEVAEVADEQTEPEQQDEIPEEILDAEVEEEIAETEEVIEEKKPSFFKRLFSNPIFSAALLIGLVVVLGLSIWHSFKDTPAVVEADEVIATVGDQEIYAYEVRFFCKAYRYDVETSIEYLAEQKRMIQVAKEHNITLSEEQKAEMEQYFEMNVSEYGDQFQAQLDQFGITLEQFKKMNEENALYSNVMNKIPELGLMDGFTIKEVKPFYDENFLRAKHVLIAFTNPDQITEETENVVSEADALAKATEVAKRLNEGENIDTIIAELSDDKAGSQSKPNGYVFVDATDMDDAIKSGLSNYGLTMVDEFTAATAALEIGAISEPVKSTYGYHVIQRLDINENEEIFNEVQGDVFYAMSVVKSDDYNKANETFLKSLEKKYEIDIDQTLSDALMIEMYKVEHDPANQQQMMPY